MKKRKERKKMEEKKEMEFVKQDGTKLKLASPWVQYVNALHAMFVLDHEIKIEYDEDSNVKLYVDNHAKAEALGELLPKVKKFGDFELKITIIPANKDKTKKEIIADAFRGNQIFAGMIPIEGVFVNPLLYVQFRKEVIQFYNDNLGDPHGNRTTLSEELARELFREMDGVIYCTESG